MSSQVGLVRGLLYQLTPLEKQEVMDNAALCGDIETLDLLKKHGVYLSPRITESLLNGYLQDNVITWILSNTK